MKLDLYEQRKTLTRRGAEFVPMGMSMICLKILRPNFKEKYVVNQGSEASELGVSFRECIV